MYFASFSRGRVIPADLEAKVIEAKQKVNVRKSPLTQCFLSLAHCFGQRHGTMRHTLQSRVVLVNLYKTSAAVSMGLLLLSTNTTKTCFSPSL